MGLFDGIDGDKELSSKAESKLRWPTLLFVCVSLVGSFYTYDEPAALKTQIGDYMGEPDDYETLFSLLYSVYSFPNIFLPFFGGYLVDRFKARNCQVLFSLLALVGNIVFAVGMTAKLWSVMYVGRIIHGCGGISICISALALLAEWFTGKELALAFGCELSVCRLSGVMSNLVNPRVAEARDVESAIWLGVLLCAASFLSALAVHPMDLFVEGKLHAPAGPSDANDVADEGAAPVANPMRSYNVVGKLADDSHISIAERDFKHVATCTDVTGSSRGPSSAGAPDKWTVSYQLGIVKTFSPLFWLLCLSCVCVYGCVFPFNNIASTLLLERNYFKAQPNSECALHDSSPGACQNSTNVPNEYCNNGQWFQPPVAEGAEVNCDNNPPCYSIYCSGQENAEIEAASIMSIPYIITACLCPFFGSLVDTYGQRATVLLLAPAMLCMVHILIGFSDVNMVILLVGQGLSYCSFAAVMWPSVSLVLNPDNYGLGYGFVFAIQNLGTASIPLIVAEIYLESGQTYIPNVELVFICLAGLASCGGLYMCHYDCRHNGVFNSPSGMPAEADTARTHYDIVDGGNAHELEDDDGVYTGI